MEGVALVGVLSHGLVEAGAFVPGASVSCDQCPCDELGQSSYDLRMRRVQTDILQHDGLCLGRFARRPTVKLN